MRKELFRVRVFPVPWSSELGLHVHCCSSYTGVWLGSIVRSEKSLNIAVEVSFRLCTWLGLYFVITERVLRV